MGERFTETDPAEDEGAEKSELDAKIELEGESDEALLRERDMGGEKVPLEVSLLAKEALREAAAVSEILAVTVAEGK